jgi:formylglycine-generating enzyme required for sulfatase activity
MLDSLPQDRLTYLDFDLEIGSSQGREYPVAVLHSPAGEARETLRFPFDDLQLESRLKDLQIALLRSGGKRRQIPSPDEQAVQAFGGALFNALFAGEVRSRYDVSQERAAQSGKGLRVKLRIAAPELAALPWEFLYDSRQADFVCLSRNTPLVRYLECPQPVQPLAVTPPLRVLGLIASPSDQEPLDVSRERQRVEDALKSLVQKGLAELVWWEEGQTWRDLLHAMRAGPWHVFHFVGHGGFDRTRDEGLIILPDDDGRSHYLPASDLARLLSVQRTLRLVVLNACEGSRGGDRDIFSSTAAMLVRRGVPAVVAMQYAITDQAAVEFAHAFYEALADGLPVDAAVSDARQAVSLAVTHTVEWGTPMLHMRAPNGRLFDFVPAMPAAPAPPRPSEVETAVVLPKPEPLPVVPPRPDTQPADTSSPSSETETVATKSPAQPQPRPLPKRLWLTAGGAAALLVVIVVMLIIRGGGGGGGSISVSPVDGMEQEYVPAGEFTMGSADGDSQAVSDEKPQHRVYLDAYWVDRTKVTNAMFAKFVAASGYKTHAEEIGAAPVFNTASKQSEETTGANWQHPRGVDSDITGLEQHPVVQVSWNDAAAYCAWVGRRLPTEAEWEKAARGTDGRKFPWGYQEVAGDLLNFADRNLEVDWAEKNINDGYQFTAPVGSYPSGVSPCGALDMAGNVWEWVADWYNESYYSSAPAQNPTGPASGEHRVLRGGSWYTGQSDVRAVNRYAAPPGYRNDHYGFRCVRSG